MRPVDLLSIPFYYLLPTTEPFSANLTLLIEVQEVLILTGAKVKVDKYTY